MPSLSDLKAIEDARQNILAELKWKPQSYDELWADGSTGEHLRALLELGLVDCCWIKLDSYYWLTEAGFNHLGYKQPDYYGDPTCEECRGKGETEAWEAGDEPETCENCDGSGAEIHEAEDLFFLDDTDEET